jgi:isochorismate hydrolase
MSDPDSIAIFSPAQITNVRALLNERWGSRLEETEDFKVSAALVGAHVTAGLLVMGGASRYLSEASINHEQADLPAEDAALLLLDMLEGYFADFLDADRISKVPLDWADVNYQGHPVQVRGDVTRPGIDDAADQLLAEDG